MRKATVKTLSNLFKEGKLPLSNGETLGTLLDYAASGTLYSDGKGLYTVTRLTTLDDPPKKQPKKQLKKQPKNRLRKKGRGSVTVTPDFRKTLKDTLSEVSVTGETSYSVLRGSFDLPEWTTVRRILSGHTEVLHGRTYERLDNLIQEVQAAG